MGLTAIIKEIFNFIDQILRGCFIQKILPDMDSSGLSTNVNRVQITPVIEGLAVGLAGCRSLRAFNMPDYSCLVYRNVV